MNHRIVRFATRRLLNRRPIKWVGVSRLTIVDHRRQGHGLVIEAWHSNVELMLQDDGHTLKLWITDKEGP